jgi:homoserine dehydrogenase
VRAGDPFRVAVVGLGMVGEWLLRAIERRRDSLAAERGVDLRIVALATRGDGFVHSADGIDVAAALALRGAGRPLTELDGVEHWPTALAGLEATPADVLAEVSQSPLPDGEPGLAHIRHALGRGTGVATSNKWPVALAGVELEALARRQGTRFRAESTVMSGTPVLAALATGIGGATPVRLRGVLNATVNSICTRIAAGVTYAEALAEAQAAGLAEPDPRADVDGLDSVAKLMVLAALVFRIQLELGDVERRGIADVDAAEFAAASAAGCTIREVATFDPAAGVATVAATALPAEDPLFGLAGVTNAVRLEADPLGEVTITGPGAGPALAGLGVFSDLLALARESAWTSPARPAARAPRPTT